MLRRSFMKLGGLSLFSSALGLTAKSKKVYAGEQTVNPLKSYWSKDGYFIQENVDTSEVPDRVWARVDGKWKVYPIAKLPLPFIVWNMEKRLHNIDDMLNMKDMHFDGSHNAAVATYSDLHRLDSQFKLNNAIKGMGMCPKQDRIRDFIDEYETTIGYSTAMKLQILKNKYQDIDNWDRTRQISLELYTSQDWETHTFLNQMRNAESTIVFLDMTSYEIRAIAKLVHPKDPRISQEEKNCVEYSNTVHKYFHGDPIAFIGVIYYVIEVFDNSPRTYPRGKRVVPPYEY
ncbi:hypothetical protein KKB18_03380 [bacterium]|nr:hypothetical protein [bacterium]